MAKEKEDEVPKKRASLRALLQSQNLKDERVLRERKKKSPRRRMSQQQRNKISQRMKDYWGEQKEVKGLIKFIGKTVRETGKVLLNSLRTRVYTGCGTQIEPRTGNTNRRPKTNKKPNKKNKGSKTKKTRKNKKAQKKPRTSTRRPLMARTYAMRARKGERRGRPSHA